MIINTGSRTDIPAFYSEWFYHRIEEGFVLVRNPYHPVQVSRYRLDPEVVDVLSFCTKNPKPMLPRIDELRSFRQFWNVTITPYGKDIEPFVPPAEEVAECFCALSNLVGKKSMSWRYDPVLLIGKYDMEFHRNAFAKMAKKLEGATDQCVISFVDLYEKTKRNFPEIRSVSWEEQVELVETFAGIAKQHGMQIHLCHEKESLAGGNVDANGCFSQAVLESAIGTHLHVPGKMMTREGCNCLLGADIGAYNSCLHGCRYCYANYDRQVVKANYQRHDPKSPFLIGNGDPSDIIHDAEQKSWIDGQLSIFDLF